MIAVVMVGLIGDLEGEQTAAVDCLRLLGERGDVDVAYQLGDLRFGYGSAPEAYLAAIESVCDEYEIQLFCMGGRSFVALGSAPSVNRDLLTEGIDWWPTEVLREEHVRATIAGGHAGCPGCPAPAAGARPLPRRGGDSRAVAGC
jgi:hypothetical protein